MLDPIVIYWTTKLVWNQKTDSSTECGTVHDPTILYYTILYNYYTIQHQYNTTTTTTTLQSGIMSTGSIGAMASSSTTTPSSSSSSATPSPPNVASVHFKARCERLGHGEDVYLVPIERDKNGNIDGGDDDDDDTATPPPPSRNSRHKVSKVELCRVLFCH